MLFNSHEFIFVYLPLVFLGFFSLASLRPAVAAAWLALASLGFYGYWDVRYIPLLLLSVCFNYAMGVLLAKLKGGRFAGWILAAGISVDLLLLAYFKYADFFIASINAVAGTSYSLLGIVLPLGISFFTFTQIAFLVDVRRGLVKEYNFSHYLLFVTYFPHLIAGPVLHHAQMMPQFSRPQTYRIQLESVAAGSAMFIFGLAKKILLADNLAEYVAPVFDNAANGMAPQFYMAWASSLAYTFQLYFDFSGYSDMAIGLSLLFGIQLPLNFNSPYKSGNIIEFWRRWHMTLSHFLRDYLYIPLGGNRQGRMRRHVNLLVTMLLGGLWHGANWTFVVWGGLHGLYLVFNHAWQKISTGWRYKPFSSRAGRVIALLITFLATVVAWVYFRADHLGAAHLILRAMTGSFGWENDLQLNRLRNLLLLAALVAFLLPNSQEWLARGKSVLSASRPAWIVVVAGSIFGLVLAILVLMLSRKSEFLYFQF